MKLQEESRQDVESFWKGSDNKLKAEQDKVAKLQSENELLKGSVNKVGNESTYFSGKIAALNSENMTLVSNMTELKRELNMLKAQLEDTDNRKNKLITDNSDTKEKMISLQTQIDMLTSENNSYNLENEVKKKQIKQLESDRDNYAKLLDSNKKGWDSNETRMADLMKTNHGLNDSVFQFQSELNRLHEENRNYANNTEDLQSRLDNATKHIKALEVELSRTGNTNSSLKEMSQDLEDQRQIVRDKNREIVELKGKVSKIELDYAGAQNKVNNLLGDKQLLETEINGMQNEFTQICQKLSQLEDRDMLIKS